MKKLMALLLSLALLIGCFGAMTMASAEQGEAVVVGIAGDPGNIGPFQGMGLGRIGILFTTYEMLVAKTGSDFYGVLMKDIAEIDELTYDVEIYDYIHDQAGNPLTASDIKFCYDTAKASGNLPKLAAIDSVEVISDYVARFHFVQLAAGDLYSLLMECPIVTQAAYEASADQMATDPVTTSPYRVTSYATGSTIEMEYSGNYWQTDDSLVHNTSKHNVNKITFKIIPDAVQLVNALKTKEIDISAAIDASYIKDFMGADGFNVTQFPDSITKYLIFNNNVFGDQKVRQGICYALDAEDVNLFAYDGLAMIAKTVGNSKYPDFVPAWNEEDYYEYDADKANALFAEAGFTGGAYRLMYSVTDINTLIATTIQADLMEFGINLELVPYDNALFNTYKYANDGGEWDLMLDEGGSSGLLCNVWKLTLNAPDQVHGMTIGYVADEQLQALMTAALEDNSPENMDAFHQYLKDQAYEYGLVAPVVNLAHTDTIKTAMTCFRGQVIPGACEY